MELFINTLMNEGNAQTMDLDWLQYEVHILFKRTVQQKFLAMEYAHYCVLDFSIYPCDMSNFSFKNF